LLYNNLEKEGNRVRNTILDVNKSFFDEKQVPSFGYELLREVLLPDLLGKDTPQLLYWAGKNLARKYPLDTIEMIVDFFTKAGWGHLTLDKDKKDELEFHLTGDLISNRLSSKEPSTFQLEAGFLAQQIQLQKGRLSEAHEQQKNRALKVIFTVKTDKKDIINTI
jgi:predicted hydrocarbon binding protein